MASIVASSSGERAISAALAFSSSRFWLYERRPEDWLLDLAHALRVEGFDNGLSHEVPDSRVPLTPPQQVRLIPYGCTNLRMTEMPWIQAESPT